MAANQWDDAVQAINDAVGKVAKAIGDAAEVEVNTQFVLVAEDGSVDFTQAKPIAQTKIKLDGDYDDIIPVRAGVGDEGSRVDDALYSLHQDNVSKALKYRADLVTAFMNALQSLAS